MGCHACSNSHSNEQLVLQELIQSIKAESATKLKQNLSNLSKIRKQSLTELVKLKLITIRSQSISILTYAFLSGSLKCVKILIKECKASFSDMQKIFDELNLNPLSILCDKNYFSLLKFYLPFYYQHIMKESFVPETTFEADQTEGNEKVKHNKTSFTPIQVACFKGNLPVFSHLVAFNMKYPHFSLDFKEINEETGENCALIAVRSGNLPMVKYLFEELKADFGQLNLFQENAILICACSSSKSKENDDFDGILFYLIEVVCLDPCFNYEEVLMMLEKKSLVEYYENLLKEYGIVVDKREIDLNYRVKFHESHNYFEGYKESDSFCPSSISFCSEEISGH